MNSNEGEEMKGVACDDLRSRKTTLEKRVRESSGVSSSSGECLSGESRAANEDGQANEVVDVTSICRLRCASLIPVGRCDNVPTLAGDCIPKMHSTVSQQALLAGDLFEVIHG